MLLGVCLVQLGGLEPPTSCSTDRRSNQLSYNCIRCRPRKYRAGRTGRKLGATPVFGKAAAAMMGAAALPNTLQNKKPARTARAFRRNRIYRSGGRLEQPGRVGLDRLGGLGRDLLAEFGEFPGLRGRGLQLPAGM